jgi:hypothetical protein
MTSRNLENIKNYSYSVRLVGVPHFTGQLYLTISLQKFYQPVTVPVYPQDKMRDPYKVRVFLYMS